MVSGGWRKSSGLRCKGCMCEVINLRDLLHILLFPPAHTQFLAMAMAFSSRQPIAQEGEGAVGGFLRALM